MTASPVRRRRSVQVGGVVIATCVVTVLVVAIVAVTTLRASREGRAPDVDNRQVVEFPRTPNAAIGIVDDLDRLTSLAVLTLDPSGRGGSIVVVPVNLDATNGFGPERQPISRRPFAPGDEDDAAELVGELEPLFTLTIERSLVLGPDELDEWLAPVAPLDVDLPERVIDLDTPGSGFVAAAGEQRLDLETLVAAFTAISTKGASYSHHDVDVALWTAIATAVTGSGIDADVPTDDFGRPMPPESVDELVDRLFAGEVAARDLAITERGAVEIDNDTEADFVVTDRLDALLVFTAISPGLVSTPNEALSFRLVVNYGDDQIAELGEGTDGLLVTKESLTRGLIGELLFSQVNVVAVDLADTSEGVPETTRLVVREENFVDGLSDVVDQVFPDADVAVADEIIDNVDVVVVLGLDFLKSRQNTIEKERDVADAGSSTDGTTEFVDPDGTAPTVASGSAPSADTVDDDG